MTLYYWCLVVIVVNIAVAGLLCLAIRRGKRQLKREFENYDDE